MDRTEARRLYGLAADQGHAKAQYKLADMHYNGEGGPMDRAEARRLYGVAAKQGHAEAKLVLERLANEAAEALLAEEEGPKQPPKAKAKSRKGKARAHEPAHDGGSAQLPPPPQDVDVSSHAPGGDASGSGTCDVTDSAAPSARSAADDALRAAMADGALETIMAALETHRVVASEAVVAEARAMRDKRRKKQSQKQRRAHAGAMQALATLQSAQHSPDASTLHTALDAAAGHVGQLPALDEQVTAAQGLLASMSLEGPPAASSEAAAPPRAIELSTDELSTATDHFADERIIGMGGFGKVYAADTIASLTVNNLVHGDRLAVKRANSGLAMADVRAEMRILQDCQHDHLIPLYAYCLDSDAPCLVFPLMVGGSLQTRLELKPRDVTYLKAMGHFDAAPKPLTWRQRVRAVLQALEALIYLHTRSPRVLHRDFKPANILLDASLRAFLGDTGFAKAAHRSGDVSKVHNATTGRVMGSPGYANMDVFSGQYSETTEGFAVGRTLLVVMTNRDPVDIEDELEQDHDETQFADIPAVQMAEAGVGWTAEAADVVKELYHGLCVVRKRNMLKLTEVQQRLHALLQSEPRANATSATPAAAPSSTTSQANAVGAAPGAAVATDGSHASEGPSALSRQVKGMRPSTDGPRQSVQRNVSAAFQSSIQRLDALFQSARERAPSAFKERIDFWRDACRLPADVHKHLHVLRKWRNASEHQDEERWASEGPSDAAIASQHIAALDAQLRQLEQARGARRSSEV